MAIQRWDPLRDMLQLQERMNRLFEEVLARSSEPGRAEATATTGWKPPLDLFEDDGRYVLRADLPGVAAADVELQVEDGRLVLRGERRLDPSVDGKAYLRVERPHGRFAVEVALPPSVDVRGIQATHRNGVMEVSMPKLVTEAHRGRIPVLAD
jgi:HSP20 family protein